MDKDLFRLLLVDSGPGDFDHLAIGERLKRHVARLRDYDDTEFLPYATRKKCESRAAKLVSCRLRAQGMRHLKEEVFNEIKHLIGGVRLAGCMTESRADEVAAEIHAEFPWMASATEVAWRSMRLSASCGEPVKLGPLLLAGPPGLGKTAWSHYVGSALQTPVVDVDASSGAGQFALVGLERGWGSAGAGRIVRALIQHAVGNPLIFVDELDKAKEVRSKSGRDVSFTDALLPLIEMQSARRWTCPFYSMPLDMTRLSWIFAANDANLVPDVLLSRIEMVKIEMPSLDLITWFLEREADRAGLSDAAKGAAVAALEASHSQLRRPISLRDATRIVRRAEALERTPVLH